MEEQLITAVKGNECIWNTKHPQYDRKKQISNLWQTIGANLSLSKDQVRSKWSALKTLFWKYDESIPYLKSGKAGSPWIHYEAMLFLKDTTTTRRINGSCDLSGEEEPELNSADEPRQKRARESSLEKTIPNKSNSSSKEEKCKKVQCTDMTSLSAEHEAEWNFLKSLVPNMVFIDGEDNRAQFRLETMLSMFRFRKFQQPTPKRDIKQEGIVRKSIKEERGVQQQLGASLSKDGIICISDDDDSDVEFIRQDKSVIKVEPVEPNKDLKVLLKNPLIKIESADFQNPFIKKE